MIKNVINKEKFQIEIDLDKYTAYESSGVAKYVKTPKIVEFKSLEEYLKIYDELYAELKEKGPKGFSIDKIIEV